MSNKENIEVKRKGRQANYDWRKKAVGNTSKRSSHSDEEEEKPLAKKQRYSKDKHLVGGRIASIELENFMCHEKLRVDFDLESNNCFYIGGPNGSGKSALFAAMNIGLGGRGNHNDRGKSVKDYIKSGKKSAKIRITLTNRGQGASTNLGELVVVERSISDNGSSAYRIKTIAKAGVGGKREEKLVSTKKCDLDKLLDRYCIQLCNPIFWMSQDRSRHFLQQMKPDSLYKIFIYATELDHTRDCYVKAINVLSDISRILILFKKQSEEKKRECEKALEQLKQRGDINKMKKELRDLGWFLIWAPLRDARDEQKDLRELRSAAVARREELKKMLLTNREERNQKLEMADQVKDEMAQFSEEMDNKTSFRSEKKAAHQEAISEEKDIKTQIMEKEERMQNMKNAVRNIETSICQKEKEITATQAVNERRRLAGQIDGVCDELRTLGERRHLAEKEVEEAENESAEARDNLEENSAAMGELKQDIQKLESQIRQARACRGNALARFGEHVPRILDLIKANRHRFQKEPLGPVGSYLTMREPAWAFAVEEAVGPSLCSFVLDNQADRRTFEQLLRQQQIHLPNTIVARFSSHSHDTDHFSPPADWPTLDRVLHISDPTVRNALIDTSSIESILLIDSDRKARDILDGNCPPNVRFAMTQEGGRGYGRNADGTGQYRFYPNLKNDRRPQMLTATDIFDEKALEDERQRQLQQIESLKKECIQLQAEAAKTSRSLHLAQRSLNETIEKIRRLSYEKNRLARQLEQLDEKDDDGILANLRESKEETLKKLEEAKNDKKDLMDDLKRASERVQAAFDLFQEANVEIQNIVKDLDPLQERSDVLRKEIDALDMKYEQMSAKSKQIAQKIEESDTRDTRLERLCEEREAEAIETTKNGLIPPPTGISDPPDLEDPSFPQASTGELKELYEKQERKIELAEKVRLLKKPVTEEQFQQMRQSFLQGKKYIKRLEYIEQKLKECVSLREQRFPIMRHSITRRLKDSFCKLMAIRGYEGELRVRNEAKAIDIQVLTHKQSRERKRRSNTDVQQDLKGLSGGERSYTTACFIMSLWEVMEAPFRCMDEFDVFMDMVNRKIVMDLLVKLATEEFSYSQFIFFTPQGIRELGKRNRVQVFEMPKVRG